MASDWGLLDDGRGVASNSRWSSWRSIWRRKDNPGVDADCRHCQHGYSASQTHTCSYSFGLVDTWVDEIRCRFSSSFDLKLFYGTVGAGGTSDPVRKKYIVTPKKLEEMVRNLSPDDPKTSRTIVLSAYTTWHSRTIKRIGRLDSSRESLEEPEEDPDEELE